MKFKLITKHRTSGFCVACGRIIEQGERHYSKVTGDKERTIRIHKGNYCTDAYKEYLKKKNEKFEVVKK